MNYIINHLIEKGLLPVILVSMYGYIQVEDLDINGAGRVKTKKIFCWQAQNYYFEWLTFWKV